MDRRRIWLIFFLLYVWISSDTAAQDDLFYRHSYLHPFVLNPAVAGSEFIPQACLSLHKQWMGIPGSPVTMLASAAIRIGNYDFYNPRQLLNTSNLKTRERIGLGLMLFNDQNGPAVQRGGNIAYAYHLELEESRLSLGLAGSAEHRRVVGNRFNPSDPDDPLLANTLQTMMLYNVHTGIYYYSPGLFGGFAVHHLLPAREGLPLPFEEKPDLILHGGYLFRNLNRPALEIRLDARYLNMDRMEYDLHVRSYIQKEHWVALSVRSYRALTLLVGFRIKGFHLVYSYEANLSRMIRYSSGSHGLHLGMNVGFRRTSGF